MSRTDVSRPEADLSTSRPARADGVLTLAGAGVFAALIIVLHVVEDDFRPCCRFISEYVLGDWGWLMNVAFIAMGCAFVAVAHGLRCTLSPGRRVTASVRLMYITGITTFISGLFNSDSLADSDAGRTSWHGMIHDLSGFIGIALVLVALFFLRGVFARDPQWRRFAPHALLFAIACLVTFVVMMLGTPDNFGVAQRVFVTVDALCLATLGCCLLTAPPAVASEGAKPALRP